MYFYKEIIVDKYICIVYKEIIVDKYIYIYMYFL